MPNQRLKGTLTLEAPSENEAALRVKQSDANQVNALVEMELANGTVVPIIGAVGAGGGDPQSIYVSTTGTSQNVAVGTTAAPDTAINPPYKIVRKVSILRGAISGDGGEQLAAILGISVGDAANQVQTVGVYGGATNAGTSNGGSGGVDSCGMYAIGRILGAGVGTGIGLFAAGRREINSGRTCAIEGSAQNFTATAGTYSSTGFSDVTGLWVECTGNSDAAVGISFGNPFGFQYDVGIGFTAQNVGGKIGGVKTASISDDSNSATSIRISGTHTTAAITVGASSGAVLLGGTTAINSSSKFEVIGPAAASLDPTALIGNSAGSFSYTLWIRNSVAVSKIGVCGGNGSFITGTTAGDLIIYNSTGGATGVSIGGAASVVIRVAGNASLGFYNTTPVAQYNTTGTAAGFTAGAGTTVTDQSTFTGNTGATAYRISDIVRALKLLGLIAA